KADSIALNTDPKSLNRSNAKTKILIRHKPFFAIDTGSKHERVYQATWEYAGTLRDLLENSRGVLILAGLGGGTGSGAAPVVAQIARESGAAVVSLVTLPFRHEGPIRHQQAQEGL